MNPGVRSQESGVRGRAAVLSGFFAGLAGCVLVVSLVPGCGKPPKNFTQTDKDDPTAKGKPWDVFRQRLKKDTDFAACKTALAGLNGDLQSDPTAPKPYGLSKEAEAALAALVPLNADDLAEVGPAAFTPHDPAYLAECLYFRDVARSLDVPPRPGRTPEQVAADRADLAFAWVCRQVYLNPWTIPVPDAPGSLQAAPVPPTFVLRRGSGSGLERMYVFLALLQQMNLDGCLVGPADAKDRPAGFVALAADGKTALTGFPRGPFWAAGVRVGTDVRLYDPWRGGPFPEKLQTLSKLKANAEAEKAWFADKANASGVTAAEAKDAAVFLAVPVNSLAPRMAVLEDQLKSEVGVNTSVDAAALRNAFADPKPAFWNPPNDRYAYGRVLRTFLSPEDGGNDRSEPKQFRVFSLYMQSLLPREQLVLLPQEFRDISPDVGERVWGMTALPYFAAFFNPPSPREKIQRGQFQDAARELVTRQDLFWQGLERLRNSGNAEGEMAKWAEEARQLYRELALAPPNSEAKQTAATAVERLWQQKGGVVQLVVDRIGAELGHTEATFLLALCKHEQAERAQAQLEHAAGPDAEALGAKAKAAWQAADGEWQTYTSRAGPATSPGRAAHAQALAARAADFAWKK